ncbi:hypothetical protein K490DRAFT_53577 [Saccharata proteae CBS 121410]|uniref:Uncharacterized protein n=1 Tax=Saccharata proteae CBS 121410 TaxID=1314787 RepID=A0A9P4HWP1_9PEZI|nr:hypothetical protein K490DRAFT_53577 [Saccharata proteae CBS 121410]
MMSSFKMPSPPPSASKTPRPPAVSSSAVNNPARAHWIELCRQKRRGARPHNELGTPDPWHMEGTASAVMRVPRWFPATYWKYEEKVADGRIVIPDMTPTAENPALQFRRTRDIKKRKRDIAPSDEEHSDKKHKSSGPMPTMGVYKPPNLSEYLSLEVQPTKGPYKATHPGELSCVPPSFPMSPKKANYKIVPRKPKSNFADKPTTSSQPTGSFTPTESFKSVTGFDPTVPFAQPIPSQPKVPSQPAPYSKPARSFWSVVGIDPATSIEPTPPKPMALEQDPQTTDNDNAPSREELEQMWVEWFVGLPDELQRVADDHSTSSPAYQSLKY